MIKNLLYLLDYIYRGKEMNAVYIIGVALLVIRIVVPILLILIGSIDLVKALIENDSKQIKNVVLSLITKVVISIIIFILPLLLLLILKLTNKYSDVELYYTCLLSPTKCNVELWEDPPVLVENPIGDGYIVYVRNRNGIYVPADEYLTEEYLLAMLQDYLTAYYGSYDPNRPITPNSLDPSGYAAIGVNVGNRKQSAIPITDYININEYNQKIGDIVRKYGFNTRESVVEIAKLMATMSEEYTVPYQLGGSYRSNTSEKSSYLGINSNWGTLGSNGERIGMDCRNSVIWIYGQAGINMIRGLAYQGEGRQIKDITKGKPGDVLDSLGHIMLITDKDATGYTVLEENGNGGWVNRKYTFADLERSNGDLDYKVYDMTDTINGTNKYINENDTGYGTRFNLNNWEQVYGKYEKTSSKKQEQTSSKKEQISSKKEQTSTKTEEKNSNAGTRFIDRVKDAFSKFVSFFK